MQFRSLLADRRGYSLGELLTVIVILGIIAALAIPRLDWMAYRVNGEVRQVAMQLSYAQRLAVSLQHNVQVTIDHDNRRMIVDEDANNDGIFSSNERRRVLQLETGLNFERNSAPALPAPSPDNEVTQIIFRRDGSASQSGAVFLNTARGVAGGNNKDARALVITRATGRASSFTYLNGSWVARM